MLTKVCGITQKDQAEMLDGLVDLVGYIFYQESPRYSSKAFILKRSKSVGVFVNASFKNIVDAVRKFKLDYVQLHGNESPDFCRVLKKQVAIIKAFGIDDQFDFSVLNPYEGVVDFFLFDTKTKNHGGSGRSFDWTILSCYSLKTPFLLSGGISPTTKFDSIRHAAFSGIDMNSGFEVQPGIKDIEQLKTFLNELEF